MKKIIVIASEPGHGHSYSLKDKENVKMYDSKEVEPKQRQVFVKPRSKFHK